MTDSQFDSHIQDLSSKLAHAIATAEGYFAPGSLPNRINNPGDMELGDRGYGVDNLKTVYNTPEEGWAALQRECVAILTGSSYVYSPSMTIEQLAYKWTGNDAAGAWCKIVAEKLVLDPMTKLSDWVKGEVSEQSA